MKKISLLMAFILAFTCIISTCALTAFADDTEAAETVATGTWQNLGTSGYIGIAVAAVLLIAIVVLIVVLIPKKTSTKK